MADFPKNTNSITIKKGTILLGEGDKASNAYKVITGCLKSFIIDKSGKEYILQFAPEGWVVSDLNGFMNNTPSTIFIDAIEDTEVLVFKKEDFEGNNNPSNELLKEQVNVLTRNIIAISKRLRLLLSSTAEERYLDFIHTYPTLSQRVPLKLIASYIGITPEYLSEIRHKIAKKS